MTTYFVLTDEGDCWKCDAESPLDAAKDALKAWEMEADPGYPLFVVAQDACEVFELGLTVVPLGSRKGFMPQYVVPESRDHS